MSVDFAQWTFARVNFIIRTSVAKSLPFDSQLSERWLAFPLELFAR